MVCVEDGESLCEHILVSRVLEDTGTVLLQNGNAAVQVADLEESHTVARKRETYDGGKSANDGELKVRVDDRLRGSGSIFIG